MVRNKLYWDANDAVRLSKQRKSYQFSPIVLEVPLRYLRLIRIMCACKWTIRTPGKLLNLHDH